jgi:hypothetical protein
MPAGDTTSQTLEALQSTVEELCCQYNYRDVLDLRREATTGYKTSVDSCRGRSA